MKRLLLTFMLLTPQVAFAENSSQPSLQDHVYEAYRCHAFKMRGEAAHLKDNQCELRLAQLPVRFLDDVSWDEFQKLSAAKQAELNQRGLSLFKQWELNNRPIFKKLQEKLALEMI